MKFCMNRPSLFIASVLLLTANVSMAFPLILKIKDVPDLQYSRRNTIIAAVPVNGALKKIPFAVDEMEDDALLVIRKPTKELPVRAKLHHPKQRDPFQNSLQAVHRLVLDESDFANCDEKCITQSKADAKKLCEIDAESRIEPVITRIDLNVKKTTGFIINCGKTVNTSFEPPVKLDTEKRQFISNFLSLQYQKKSPIVFEKISLNGDKNPFFDASQLEVLVKPKLFVSVHFTEDDLQTEITSYQEQGPGTSAELAMKLKTLGFTTSFEICCDITVYNDSFYFPVVVDLPFKGSSTRKGSGIFYGFNFLGDVKNDISSPLTSYDKIDKSEPVSAAVVTFKKGDNAIAIGVRPSSTEKASMMRAAVVTPEEAKKIGFDAKKSNSGVFLDVTGIKESGLQRFEIWFYGGKSGDIDLLKQYAQSGITYKTSQL